MLHVVLGRRNVRNATIPSSRGGRRCRHRDARSRAVPRRGRTRGDLRPGRHQRLGDLDDGADDDRGEGGAALRPVRLRGRRRHQGCPERAALRGRDPGGGGAEVPPRRCHLLQLDRQRERPAPDREPVQRPAAGSPHPGLQGPHPPDHLHRPGTGRGGAGRAAGDAVPRQHGARGGP
jgi:hypothetical protein